jgi:hypothetical protein
MAGTVKVAFERRIITLAISAVLRIGTTEATVK